MSIKGRATSTRTKDMLLSNQRTSLRYLRGRTRRLLAKVSLSIMLRLAKASRAILHSAQVLCQSKENLSSSYYTIRLGLK